MTEPLPIDRRDGKKRALKFTARGFRAMSIANDYRTFDKMLDLTGDDVGISAFLHAGLLWQEPTLTVEAACDLYDGFIDGGGTVSEMIEAIGEALFRSGRIRRTEPESAPA